MPEVKPIRNDADLDAALERIGELLSYSPGSPEYDELEALSDLVIEYEDIHYPIPDPTLAEAIECRMEDLGLSVEDLVPYIGSREEVAEVLAGRQSITPSVSRALTQLLRIELDGLAQKAAAPRG